MVFDKMINDGKFDNASIRPSLNIEFADPVGSRVIQLIKFVSEVFIKQLSYSV